MEIIFHGQPVEFKISSVNPDQKGGMQTNVARDWVRFQNKWFRPYGDFRIQQVKEMLEICRNESQVVHLMNLLSVQELIEKP